MTKEKAFETKVKKYLDAAGAWYVKYFANGYTKSGVPDILACVNGYFLAIEVKAETGRPSELQLWNVHNIRKAGGIAIVLYPDHFTEFVNVVNALRHGSRAGAFVGQDIIFDKEGWFDESL